MFLNGTKLRGLRSLIWASSVELFTSLLQLETWVRAFGLRRLWRLGLKRLFYSTDVTEHPENSPRTTPTDRRMMNGLRRPRVDRHRSDTDPRIGVQKNPTSGDRHQIRVMCLCRTPATEKQLPLVNQAQSFLWISLKCLLSKGTR